MPTFFVLLSLCFIGIAVCELASKEVSLRARRRRLSRRKGTRENE